MPEVTGNSGELTPAVGSASSERLGASEADLCLLLARMRGLEIDSDPEGWPAVQMMDITALCDAIVRINTKLKKLGYHAAALADALDGYQDDCGEDHPRPKFDCPTCGGEESTLVAYRDFLAGR